MRPPEQTMDQVSARLRELKARPRTPETLNARADELRAIVKDMGEVIDYERWYYMLDEEM